MHVTTKAPSSILLPHMLGRGSSYRRHIPKRSKSPQMPMSIGRPSLGAAPDLDMTTIIAGLGGAAAVLGARFTGQPTKALLNVIGIASLGFAFYRAFVDAGAPASKAADVVTSKSMPVAAAPAYERVAGVFASPTQGSTVEWERGIFGVGGTYPATILLSNLSPESVPVYYRVVAVEKPSYVWGADKNYWTPNQGEVAQGQVTLGPNVQQAVNLTLPLLTKSTIVSDFVEVTLSLQKRQSPTAEWQTLSSVTFVVG
jgi:hypothetical protein